MTNDSMAALAAARAKVADLEDQQQMAIETAGNCDSRRAQLVEQIAVLGLQIEERHAAVICGREIMQAVETLRQSQGAIKRELAEHDNEARLCRKVLDRLGMDIGAARNELAKALETAARARWAPIENAMHSNASVRAQLVEIYSLAAASCLPKLGGSGGRPVWAGVLDDAFPHPSDAELAAGMEKAMRYLGDE